MVPRRIVSHVMVLSDDPGISGLGRAGAPGQGDGGPEGGAQREALKLLNTYVDRYPQVPEARYYRALALSGLGRNKEALEDVDKALADNSGECQLSPGQGEHPGGSGAAAGGHIDFCPGHALRPPERRGLQGTGGLPGPGGQVCRSHRRPQPGRGAGPQRPLGVQQAGHGLVLPGGIPEGGG